MKVFKRVFHMFAVRHLGPSSACRLAKYGGVLTQAAFLFKFLRYGLLQ
jgi:hypothetical protein